MEGIAKRLSFHETAAAQYGREMSETAQAVEELRRAQHELSSETRNHALARLQEARVCVDNGAGENDLKRLQRKFQATKASYINVDVKERFMQSLREGTLDVAVLEDTHKGLEEQLQRDAEVLRALKDQNGQAKHALHETSAQIATLHQQFEQVMGDVAAQLDALERSLQHFEVTRPPPLEPLPDGPDQEECDAMLHEEMARAKQLEAAIAASEAAIQEADQDVRCSNQELVALQAEAARVSAMQADRAKAADATAHLSRAAKWAEAAAAAVETLGGVAIRSIEEGSLVLDVVVCVPTGLSEGAAIRDERHELVLQLRPGGAQLASAQLVPPVVAVDDVTAAASAPGGGGVRAAVGEIQLRLQQHWSLQALIDAASECHPGLSRLDTEAAAAAAPAAAAVFDVPVAGVIARVAVPQHWPQPAWCSAAPAGLSLVSVSGAGINADALVAAVNADASLAGADLATFVDAVGAKVASSMP